MIFAFLLVALLLVVAFVSPFPYLRTYALLWKYVLIVRQPGIGIRARLRQAIFLLRNGALIPLWTCLWYLDELLFPNYRKQPVQPVFIIGEPRCGTTLLHRTLAADQRNFFAIRHFEWRYPFISVQKLARALKLESMLETTSYWPNSETGRIAMRMHPNMLYDYEEDGVFFEERFMHHLFVFLRFPFPGLLPVLESFPELPESRRRQMLVTHRKVIQKVAFLSQSDSRLYLSKEVTSHHKIPMLLSFYPRARFVVLVRPASELIDSLLALVRMSTLAKTNIDPFEVPGWRDAFLERMRMDCDYLVELSEKFIDPQRQARLTFGHLTANIPEAVSQLYNFLELKLEKPFAAHLRKQEAQQNARDRGYDYQHVTVPGFTLYDRFVCKVSEAGLAQARGLQCGPSDSSHQDIKQTGSNDLMLH
ncbi:Sulfotransferase domain protein [Thiorhodovibrio winogradskyi]|uniref:Sulfotransferase domain protein n=1 Tax=Thiorhodovibrio winogradskyi TaxID=77007 RepID=A0ABZ0S626_9GAMM|nr:sulfotransferase [Thiorhodovibrio winogradskyi]